MTSQAVNPIALHQAVSANSAPAGKTIPEGVAVLPRVRVFVVLSQRKVSSPQKAPPSLNCTCVSLPPGEPPPPVEAIVTVPALPVPPVVRVILEPSMSCTLPPLAERVTV